MVCGIRKFSEEDQQVVAMNGGSQSFDFTMRLKLFPFTVQFNENTTAMILAMKDVVGIPGAKVRMDTSIEQAIFVELDEKI